MKADMTAKIAQVKSLNMIDVTERWKEDVGFVNTLNNNTFSNVASSAANIKKFVS